MTPGLINALTALGLSEVGAVPASVDTSAQGEAGVAAALRVWEGLNPDSVLWTPARNEGITSVVAVPSGGLVAGQAAFLDTDGDTRAALLRRAPVAMVGEPRPRRRPAPSRAAICCCACASCSTTRGRTATQKVAFERAATRPFVVSRLHLEALQPVLAGKLPLLVAVDRASDIQALLDLAREYRAARDRPGRRRGVARGRRRWPRRRCRCWSSALDNIPASFDALGSRQENAALLRRAGVPVVITAGAVESFNVRNVKQHAGNAVAYGLPWDEALRAVTLAPAEAFGVADTRRLARRRQGRQRRGLERRSVRVLDPRRARLRARRRARRTLAAGPAVGSLQDAGPRVDGDRRSRARRSPR